MELLQIDSSQTISILLKGKINLKQKKEAINECLLTVQKEKKN